MNKNQKILAWLNEQLTNYKSYLDTLVKKKDEGNTWSLWMKWNAEIIFETEEKISLVNEVLTSIKENGEQYAEHILINFTNSLRRELVYGMHIERCTSAANHLYEAMKKEAMKDFISDCENQEFIQEMPRTTPIN